MKPFESNNSLIEKSIEKAIDYLYNHQLPNGEFLCYMSGDSELKGWIMQDLVTWGTAVISHSLSIVKNNKSDIIQHKAMMFLGSEVKWGLWNYFTRTNEKFRKRLPFDVDDTCLISVLYKNKGIDYPNPSNIEVIKLNRNKVGLFYTWFTFRFKFFKNKTFLKIGLIRLIGTIQNILFWRSRAISINDVDLGINANVLYYLGEIPETLAVINKINATIVEKKEDKCDLWYQNPLILYYFFSRNYYKGIKSLEPIVKPIIERTIAMANQDGSIGKSAVETAWAICSLINLEFYGKELQQAIDYLINCQEEDGHWPRWEIYVNGNRKDVFWGSEEITTGFCVEALAKFNEINLNNK